MASLRVTELDFQTIKANLKTFLKSQSQFSDYNFEGSGLSIMLDVLSYNTHYNAMLAHLVANEMFLDSAIKRSSVVSHAKTLGYLPRSSVCAAAVVSFTVTPTGSPAATLVLSRSTPFSARVDGDTFTFIPDRDYVTELGDDGKYLFEDVTLLEGTRTSSQFAVAADTVSGPFLLPNANIDINTLRVTVQQSATEIAQTTWTYTSTIIDVDQEATMYWVEEATNGRYQLMFGDGIIGAALEPGNIITVEYVVTSGTIAANGAETFSLAGTIGGYTNVSFDVAVSSAGGSGPESIDSIRFNAPRYNATRNRVVTAQDYKTLIKANYPYVKGISVWGGEDNVPPIYGKVFISIDTLNGYTLTRNDKESIIRNILKPRSVLAVQHEFVDPDYLYIALEVQVKFDALRTNMSSSALESSVRAAVTNFFANEVTTLDKSFYYSRLLKYIDATDTSILGSQVAMKIHKRVEPILNTLTYINTFFNTAVEPGSVFSSIFEAEVQDREYLVKITDDSAGALRLVNTATGGVLAQNIGTVNYQTGQITVPAITITGLVGAMQELRIYGTPEELSYDMSPTLVTQTLTSDEAVYPYPAQNVILRLDTSPAINTAGTPVGLKISATASVTTE